MSSTLSPLRPRRAQRARAITANAADTAGRVLPESAVAAPPDIAMISHELRAPLTAIRGALGLIQSGTLGTLPEQAARMIDIARENSQRMLLLIDDLLTIEALAAGATYLRMETFDLADMLRVAVTANAGLVAEQRGAFVLADMLNGAMVRGDPTRLAQVLSNLMSNAAKFAPGTTVTLALRRRNTGFRITVTDQGPGIPPGFRTRIFQRFARASETATHTPGNGLGLHIAQTIMHAHGGAICFDSVAGMGTSFHMDLPAAG